MNTEMTDPEFDLQLANFQQKYKLATLDVGTHAKHDTIQDSK